MLRNKSPVLVADVSLKSSPLSVDDPKQMNTSESGQNSFQPNSAISPKHSYKPTHRRGYSQGSLNAQVNSSCSYSNVPFNSSSLNRTTTNSSSEVFEGRRQTTSNFISLMGETSNMRTAGSNDRLSSGEDNSCLYPSSHQSLSSPNDDQLRAISRIEDKIRQIKEEMKKEQIKCNENVNEYLKLTSNSTDSSQTQRVKSVFEKNNQKSTRIISRYQKKLLRYDQDLKDITEKGIINRHTRERLRDVGTNIKEGITGLSGGVIEGIRSGIHSAGETVITKPKEFFKRNTNDQKSNLEQNEQGSLGGYGETAEGGGGGSAAVQHATIAPSGLPNSNSHSHSHSTKCTSDDESSSITSDSGPILVYNTHHQSNSPLRGAGKNLKKNFALLGDTVITPTTTMNAPFDSYSAAEFEQLCLKLKEKYKDFDRLKNDIEMLKTQFHNEFPAINMSLQDEKYRVERLEEQLNDLTELHQKEIENLKQTISDLEEKIQYQTEERHRDVQEMLESFQTRISRMEHQQHQHLQQLVMLDSLENSNARALVLKLINVVLTILQVVLLLVATIANILAPFLQTRRRIFTSFIVIIVFYFVIQYWPNLSFWARRKLYENCIYFLSFFPFL